MKLEHRIVLPSFLISKETGGGPINRGAEKIPKFNKRGLEF